MTTETDVPVAVVLGGQIRLRIYRGPDTKVDTPLSRTRTPLSRTRTLLLAHDLLAALLTPEASRDLGQETPVLGDGSPEGVA
jgi:hypothetical protein